MNKKLPLFFILLCCQFLSAQEFEPLYISSGFTADVVADGLNPSSASTTMAVDNANFVFMSADFQSSEEVTPPSFALPVSGELTSPSINGLTYQLAPYSENNSLRISEQDESGFLLLSNPVMATKLYILATSGSGASTLTGNIYFANNSGQAINASVIPDWFYSNALPIVKSGFGRVNTANDIIENPSGNPRLYQLEITILPENQFYLIEGIEFTKTSAAEGIANIMAVSAALTPLSVDSTEKTSMKVYPNPMKDQLNISSSEMLSEIHVFNVLGQEVISKTALNHTQMQLNTSHLPNGTYIVKILSDQSVKTISVLKN